MPNPSPTPSDTISHVSKPVESAAVGALIGYLDYVNDAGSRMDAFNGSVYARYAQHFSVAVEVPADGYPGEYITDLAGAIAEREGRRFLDVDAEAAKPELGRLGMGILLDEIREDLERLGVRFDRWFYEQSLFDGGKVGGVMEALRGRGYVAEREGAIWFTSSSLGDDKDRAGAMPVLRARSRRRA